MARLKQIVDAITGESLLAVLGILLIATLFAMLNWWAPALVALRGASAVDAMKTSFVGILRNWVPFLVYGAIGIAIVIALMVAFFAVFLVLGAGAYLSAQSAGGGLEAGVLAFVAFFAVSLLLFAAAALVVGPVIFGSTYAGYEDVLEGAEPAVAKPPNQ
jgi:uncharacterized membrane protein